MRTQLRIFTLAMTAISRTLLWRDRLLGKVRLLGPEMKPKSTADAIASRHVFASGPNTIDAVFVKPANESAQGALLICHGIGEVVEHWLKVQHILAGCGLASLVFDYSGYGRSAGSITPAQCEEDTVAAFHFLRERMPHSPISLLGFSLGSGIATAASRCVQPHRLVLCAAFASFREAAFSCGVPRILRVAIADVWSAADVLRDNRVPVLIVHGEKDRLFPVSMAKELAGYCGANARLILVPGLTHSEPYYRPRLDYWGMIADWVKSAQEAT